MNIVGLDIGYSNLKLAYGNSENGMQTAIRPAGAAPADRFGSRIDGKEQDDFLHVLVGDEPFIAGVSSDRAEMWERSLHSEYARTPSYTALFHAGLLLSGMTEVDVLVTGLPVQWTRICGRSTSIRIAYRTKYTTYSNPRWIHCIAYPQTSSRHRSEAGW